MINVITADRTGRRLIRCEKGFRMCKAALIVSLGLALLLPLSVPVSAADTSANPAETSTAKVMVLGVAHLIWKHDVHNSAFKDNPLSPERQAQIAEVVSHLARFRPTKVLIEQPMGNPIYAQRYQRFLAGQYTLPASEDYQFGYRLAARAGNKTIYPIDTFGPSFIDDDSPAGKRIDGFLQANFSSFSTPPFAAYLARSNALEQNGTYLDLLRYLNTDNAIRANASFYSVVATTGRDADKAGSAWVSQWYARNTYLFSNIFSVIQPGDRVVVIMGQGHEYLLRDFVRLNPTLTDVDPLDYLK